MLLHPFSFSPESVIPNSQSPSPVCTETCSFATAVMVPGSGCFASSDAIFSFFAAFIRLSICKPDFHNFLVPVCIGAWPRIQPSNQTLNLLCRLLPVNLSHLFCQHLCVICRRFPLLFQPELFLLPAFSVFLRTAPHPLLQVCLQASTCLFSSKNASFFQDHITSIKSLIHLHRCHT